MNVIMFREGLINIGYSLKFVDDIFGISFYDILNQNGKKTGWILANDRIQFVVDETVININLKKCKIDANEYSVSVEDISNNFNPVMNICFYKSHEEV